PQGKDVSAFALVRNSAGVAPSSPGLPYSATLGNGAARCTVVRRTRNPEGVAATSSERTAPSRHFVPSFHFESRNPFGGWSASGDERPKVAEYGNLGLQDAIPLGLFQRVTEARQPQSLLIAYPEGVAAYGSKLAIGSHFVFIIPTDATPLGLEGIGVCPKVA